MEHTDPLSGATAHRPAAPTRPSTGAGWLRSRRSAMWLIPLGRPGRRGWDVRLVAPPGRHGPDRHRRARRSDRASEGNGGTAPGAIADLPFAARRPSDGAALPGPGGHARADRRPRGPGSMARSWSASSTARTRRYDKHACNCGLPPPSTRRRWRTSSRWPTARARSACRRPGSTWR